MKNKEIVKRLKDSLDYEFDLSFSDRKELLSYIEQLENKNKENSLLLIEFQDMEQRIEQLDTDYKEAIESVTWWRNRYNAVKRDKKQLENNRDKAIEYVKKHTYHDTPKYNGTRIMTQGCLIATNDFWYEDLLDILKGDSDE